MTEVKYIGKIWTPEMEEKFWEMTLERKKAAEIAEALGVTLCAIYGKRAKVKKILKD